MGCRSRGVRGLLRRARGGARGPSRSGGGENQCLPGVDLVVGADVGVEVGDFAVPQRVTELALGDGPQGVPAVHRVTGCAGGMRSGDLAVACVAGAEGAGPLAWEVVPAPVRRGATFAAWSCSPDLRALPAVAVVDLVRGPAWGTAAAWCEAVATVAAPDGAAVAAVPAVAGVAAAPISGAVTNTAMMAATRISAGRADQLSPRIGGRAPTAGADRGRYLAQDGDGETGRRSHTRTARTANTARLPVSASSPPAIWRAGRVRCWGTRRRGTGPLVLPRSGGPAATPSRGPWRWCQPGSWRFSCRDTDEQLSGGVAGDGVGEPAHRSHSAGLHVDPDPAGPMTVTAR